MRDDFAWPGIAAATVATYDRARDSDARRVAREAESVLAQVPATRAAFQPSRAE